MAGACSILMMTRFHYGKEAMNKHEPQSKKWLWIACIAAVASVAVGCSESEPVEETDRHIYDPEVVTPVSPIRSQHYGTSLPDGIVFLAVPSKTKVSVGEQVWVNFILANRSEDALLVDIGFGSFFVLVFGHDSPKPFVNELLAGRLPERKEHTLSPGQYLTWRFNTSQSLVCRPEIYKSVKRNHGSAGEAGISSRDADTRKVVVFPREYPFRKPGTYQVRGAIIVSPGAKRGEVLGLPTPQERFQCYGLESTSANIEVIASR